jgi:hypothetical protein
LAWFTLHQFVGSYGIRFAAPFLVASVFDVLRLFGKQYPADFMFFLLTGTPYFPIQILLGLIVGCLVSRHFHHRVMLWIWIIPLFVLVYALVAVPTFTPDLTPARYQAGVGESRLAHYFGWGCQPVDRCLDQINVTLPFYIAAFYSFGALIGQRVPQRFRTPNPLHSWIYLAAGLFFAVALCSEVQQIVRLLIRGGQWQWLYLQPLAAVGGTAGFLILYSVLVARTAPPGSASPRRN